MDKETRKMKITLKDGSVKEYAEAMTVNDIAYDLSLIHILQGSYEA